MTESTRKLATLAAKAGLVVVLTLGFLKVTGELFARYAPWQKYMDPRTCLIWNGKYDGSPYVILGDSVFCSYYVNSPKKTIWARLQSITGRKVFPGALNGAQPADLLKGAQLVDVSWPAGTVVFINVVPTRFLQYRLPKAKAGNYKDQFQRLVPGGTVRGGPATSVDASLRYWLGKCSFFFSDKTALKALVDGTFRPPVYFKQNNRRNRVWNRDGVFALKRFRTFKKNVAPARKLKPFDWTVQLHRELAAKGLRPVFVLTPLNKDLVRAYAPAKSSQPLIGALDSAHAGLLAFLASNGIAVIDLYDSAGSKDFADMIHTNERGDDLMARAMAEWIAKNAAVQAK